MLSYMYQYIDLYGNIGILMGGEFHGSPMVALKRQIDFKYTEPVPVNILWPLIWEIKLTFDTVRQTDLYLYTTSF